MDPEKLIRSEVGGYIKFAFIKKEPFNIKDISFRSNLTLFSNYINEPQNIDVTWETLTSLKIGILSLKSILSLKKKVIFKTDTFL